MYYFRTALTAETEPLQWKPHKNPPNSSSYIWIDFWNTNEWTYVKMNVKKNISAWSVPTNSYSNRPEIAALAPEGLGIVLVFNIKQTAED